MREKDPQQHDCSYCLPQVQILCVDLISGLSKPLCEIKPGRLTIIPDREEGENRLEDGSGILVVVETN